MGQTRKEFHRVVRGTLRRFDRAAYVLGSVGSRPSASARLAASILQMVVCDREWKRNDEPVIAQRTRNGSPWKLVESCHKWFPHIYKTKRRLGVRGCVVLGGT